MSICKNFEHRLYAFLGAEVASDPIDQCGCESVFGMTGSGLRGELVSNEFGLLLLKPTAYSGHCDAQFRDESYVASGIKEGDLEEDIRYRKVNADQGNFNGEDCSGLALDQGIRQDRLSFAISETGVDSFVRSGELRWDISSHFRDHDQLSCVISEIRPIAFCDFGNWGGFFCAIWESWGNVSCDLENRDRLVSGFGKW
jgi:hypothetical protein